MTLHDVADTLWRLGLAPEYHTMKQAINAFTILLDNASPEVIEQVFEIFEGELYKDIRVIEASIPSLPH